MKKKILFIITFLTVYLGLLAQYSANRTTQTIIADALAILPIEDVEQHNQTMQYLVGTGEEGLVSLIQMLDLYGEKGNETIEYALSALGSHAAKHPEQKAEFIKLVKKISESSLNEKTKQFLNHQLVLIETGEVESESKPHNLKREEKVKVDFEQLHFLLERARKSLDEGEIELVVDELIVWLDSSDITNIVKANYLQEVLLLTQSANQKRIIIQHLGNTNSFQALLALESYLEDKVFQEDACQAGLKIIFNNPEYYSDAAVRISKKIARVLDNPLAIYQRQSIHQYIHKHKGTDGFVSLFNGKNLNGWKGLVADPIRRAQMTEKELSEAQIKADKAAAKSWIVKEDGIIFFTGEGDNLCTEKQYQNFEMWVDWKLFPGEDPDAGIYLRGSPQVQIWDTSRVHVGAEVGSGGLYNNQKYESIPLKVADQKLGEWNTFYIKMIGERVTVYLNGELVTDNVILENYWDRKQAIFSKEQIELQAHGSEVMYRNIYIKEINDLETFKLTEEEKKERFKVLFDGIDMQAWTGNTRDYVPENGELVYYPSKEKNISRNLYTKEEYGDFIFRFEFLLTPAANNGLGIRTPMEGDAAYVGMELQILDDDDPIYSQLDDYQYHGSVYGIIPAKRGALNPLGEWNYQEVIAKGDHIKITLNGQVILDGNIREATKDGTPDGQEHPGLFNEKGHIAFLGHGTVVKFRSIRVKSLD